MPGRIANVLAHIIWTHQLPVPDWFLKHAIGFVGWVGIEPTTDGL